MIDLSTAVSVLERMDEERFCQAFQELSGLSFHVNDLLFWSELTGIDPKFVLPKLYNLGWKRFGKKIYVRNNIETVKDLISICKKYGLQKQDIVKVVIDVMNKHHGELLEALEQLPLSYDIVHIVLELQDELVPLSKLLWQPKSRLPEMLRVISRFAHSQQSKWDELIIATFIREGKPIRLEEIIYKSMGIIQPSVTLKCIFTFMLSILSVSKIQDTHYWVLTEWESRVDITLIDSITTLLSEQGALSIEEVVNVFSDYDEREIFDILVFWPEFSQRSDKKYELFFSPIEDSLLEIIVPTVIKLLSDAREGMSTSGLFKHIETIGKSHGLIIHSRDFKSFLKSWGEVAIVGNRVYGMHKAPLNKMRLADVAYLILKEMGSPMPYTELEAEVRKSRNYISSISSVFLSEPKLSRPSRGSWALREWGLIEYDPQIHNRISEVLVSIIDQAGRPVHKTEIRKQLKSRGMNMNEGTLHMDLAENAQINQVARGVYALTEWKLSFRDLFNYKFPFRLAIPEGNPTVYQLEDAVLIEYFISKYCLELGRVLVKRYITDYFPDLRQYMRYTVTDYGGANYEGWVDRVDEGRFQFLGIQRWYKTYKPRYGENIYLYIPNSKENAFTLLTSEQADLLLFEAED
jgi:hypothetical protein